MGEGEGRGTARKILSLRAASELTHGSHHVVISRKLPALRAENGDWGGREILRRRLSLLSCQQEQGTGKEGVCKHGDTIAMQNSWQDSGGK